MPKMVMMRSKVGMNPIAIQISTALAQFFLDSGVPPLNAHTKYMMNPTSGIAATRRVTTQSPVETGWLLTWGKGYGYPPYPAGW